MVRGELTGDHHLDDRPQNPQRAAQLTRGDEVNPRAAAVVGLEDPRPVDRLGTLHDVHPQTAWPVEFNEFGDLLKLLPARRLSALAEARTESWSPLGELFDRRLRSLPILELRWVGHIVE